jgi:hypothetical protein
VNIGAESVKFIQAVIWRNEELMHFPIISLKNSTTLRKILRGIERNPELLREMFRVIARKPKLQLEILAVLTEHPRAQRTIITELAKNRQIWPKILKIAVQ